MHFGPAADCVARCVPPNAVAFRCPQNHEIKKSREAAPAPRAGRINPLDAPVSESDIRSAFRLIVTEHFTALPTLFPGLRSWISAPWSHSNRTRRECEVPFGFSIRGTAKLGGVIHGVWSFSPERFVLGDVRWGRCAQKLREDGQPTGQRQGVIVNNIVHSRMGTAIENSRLYALAPLRAPLPCGRGRLVECSYASRRGYL